MQEKSETEEENLRKREKKNENYIKTCGRENKSQTGKENLRKRKKVNY